MPDQATGSTVPRRQLGRRLRDLRGRARLTVRAAGAALEWSEAKIWRIETGQTSMRSLDVEQMCRIYGAPTDTTASLMALAKETKARGWWLSYADVINEGFDVYIGLEEAASRFYWYESELAPGLFQTADYARTMIESDNPGVPDSEIERRVQLRIERQSLLTRVTAAPQLDIVLNEAVLRRPVGGRQVMADQLDRIAEVGDLPNVAVRVMPFAAGLHYGVMSGPFVTLEFPLNSNNQPSEPSTVYVDSFTGALFLDKPHEIDLYDKAFKEIWTASLDEAESQKMITKAARELRKS
ncbi:helix-turn-helix transcriptional regulator [Solwaraspora sp. WMMD1047]|uniref:helix-turn-helix domain-containing protein n=1 Tax=Solwaraspora sp. WMMD1047 TaxID=3016102 RepID=UPI0024173B8B|nr:helix-turn-helix transcriptional regulator [Solwaraspora sp. WMMD1047]MDG4828514.1 helix-turn-helix transcriptional regulator [Solwaraspora sp. WMMD1047]